MLVFREMIRVGALLSTRGTLQYKGSAQGFRKNEALQALKVN